MEAAFPGVSLLHGVLGIGPCNFFQESPLLLQTDADISTRNGPNPSGARAPTLGPQLTDPSAIYRCGTRFWYFAASRNAASPLDPGGEYGKVFAWVVPQGETRDD